MKTKQIYEKYWYDQLKSTGQRTDNTFSYNETIESLDNILTEGSIVLDIGCGAGYAGKILKKYFSQIYGCDISLNALQKTNTNGIDTICADMNNSSFPFKNHSIDTVICLEVIEHFLDPVNFLKESYRILKSGGRIILTTPNIRYFKNLFKLIFKGHFPHTTTDDFIWGGGHLHYFTRKDLYFLLIKTGFMEIKFHINKMQFNRSRKRNFIHFFTGDTIFGEFFCGGIMVEALKK